MADKFFISYTGQDRVWATWIAGVLEENGQPVKIQAWDFRAGNSFVAEMNESLIECDACIAVLSQAYFKSPYCRAEWDYFFAKSSKKKKTLLPVRISDVIPDGLSHTIVFVDLFGANEVEAEQRLMEGAGLRETSRRKPDFPNAPAMPRAAFPGTFPPENLPERNPFFSGREGQLNEITAQFQSGGAGCVIQTVTGLGGAGKTQIATEYARRSMGVYKDAVWFVNSETETSAFNDCRSFAETAGSIPEYADGASKGTPKQIIDCLSAWFASHSSWLFVFDHVERSEVIAPYILIMRSGHILITARERGLKQGKLVETNPFTPDEALRFMRGRLADNADLIDSETALAALAGKLNCFPLALEQAGSYMESAKKCCSEYLALLDKHGIVRVLAARQSAPKNYRLPVPDVLALAFEKLNISARQLFSLCACMSPDGIPLAFFRRQLARLPNPLREDFGDDFKQDDIIAELLNYALVKRDGDCLHMDRLAREIGRDRAGNGETDWLGVCGGAVIEDLRSIADYSGRDRFERFAQIAAHCAAAAVQAERVYAGDADMEKQTARLYHLLGAGCKASARYDQALEWYQKALEIRERALGKEHPETAETYNNIAGVRFYLGDYSEALGLYQKALAIRENALGKDSPAVASTYGEMARVRLYQNEYEPALELYQKALGILEKALGMGHPDTAAIYDAIAEVYVCQGYYSKALELYRKVLDIREGTAGGERLDTADTYCNIARVYSYQSKFDKALELYGKALAIRENILGREHPDTAVIYDGIAGVYTGQGDFRKALEFHREALAILEKTLGKEHLDTAETYGRIAGVYARLSDYHNVLEWYLKALAVYEKAPGADSPTIIAMYKYVAEVYYAQGEYSKALEWYFKVFAVCEKTPADGYPDAAAVCECIADVYIRRGNNPMALEWYKKALAIREGASGKEHPDTGATYCLIAGIYFAQGDYAAALEWYMKGYKIYLSYAGDSHPGAITVRDNMEASFRNINMDEPFDIWLENNLSRRNP